MKPRFFLIVGCATALTLAPCASAQVPKTPKDPGSKSAENADKAARRAKQAEKAGEASRQAGKAAGAEKAAAKSQSAQKAAEKAESAQRAAEQAQAGQKAAARVAKPVEIRQPVQPKEPVAPKVSTKPVPTPSSNVVPPKPSLIATQKPAPVKAKPAATPKPAPNRQVVADVKTDNPVREPGGGPKPGVAEPDRNAAKDKADALVPDALKGQTDRTANLKDEAAVLQGGGASSAVDGRLNDSKTQRPKFDQGFADKPVVSEADTAGRNPTNPLKDITGGTVVGGPLADAANKGSGVSGVSQQGSSAVSDAPLPKGFTAGKTFTSEALKNRGVPVTGSEFGDKLKGISNAKTGEFAVVIIDSQTGLETIISETAITVRGADGKVITSGPVDKAVGAHFVEVAKAIHPKDVPKGEKAGAGKSPATTGEAKPAPLPGTPGVKTPVDENAPLKFDIVNTDTLAEQVRQAKITIGGGVTDPVRGDTAGAPVSGPTGIKGALPQDDQIRNLVGSPVAPGVVNESGGNKGLDSLDQSRGAGGIRPTDDTTITTGGITQNPGDVFGNGVAPAGLDATAGRSGGTPPASSVAVPPAATLELPLPEDKTAVRDAVAPVSPPLDSRSFQAPPVNFSEGTGKPVAAPNLSLAAPLPDDKAAVARSIGPVSNVNGREGTQNVTTGGTSDSTSSSGAVNAGTGGSSAEKQESAPPVGDGTDPASKAGELSGDPPPLPRETIVTKPLTPRTPTGGVVTPLATPKK